MNVQKLNGGSHASVLAEQIKKRLETIMRVCEIAGGFLSEKGKVLDEHVGGDCTNVVKELKNLDGFSFWQNSGQNHQNGTDVKIWYHGNLVMDLHYEFGPEKSAVKGFDITTDWVSALEDLNNRKQDVFNRINTQEQIASENCQKVLLDKKDEAEVGELRAKAKRLGIDF